MKIRVYPRIRYLDFPEFIDTFIPTKKQKTWNRDVFMEVPWSVMQTYLEEWYPGTFTFSDGYAEADVDERGKWYQWHIKNCVDHQKFISGKWVSGI